VQGLSHWFSIVLRTPVAPFLIVPPTDFFFGAGGVVFFRLVEDFLYFARGSKVRLWNQLWSGPFKAKPDVRVKLSALNRRSDGGYDVEGNNDDSKENRKMDHVVRKVFNQMIRSRVVKARKP
jgi:hypothetical protein